VTSQAQTVWLEPHFPALLPYLHTKSTHPGLVLAPECASCLLFWPLHTAPVPWKAWLLLCWLQKSDTSFHIQLWCLLSGTALGRDGSLLITIPVAAATTAKAGCLALCPWLEYEHHPKQALFAPCPFSSSSSQYWYLIGIWCFLNFIFKILWCWLQDCNC
jgi:hypothetical protein